MNNTNSFSTHSFVVSIYNAVTRIAEQGGQIAGWWEETPEVEFLEGVVKSFSNSQNRKVLWSWAKTQNKDVLWERLLRMEVYDKESHLDYPEF